jgi:hypothetical protein
MTSLKLDFVGIGEMLRAPYMVAEMGRRAELVKIEAEATAPFDPSPDGPHYKDQFHVEVTDHGGVHGDRAEGAVTNDSEHAFFVEFLNGDRTLGRALDAAAG